jgi:hypothetical protein
LIVLEATGGFEHTVVAAPAAVVRAVHRKDSNRAPDVGRGPALQPVPGPARVRRTRKPFSVPPAICTNSPWTGQSPADSIRSFFPLVSFRTDSS